MLLWMGITTCGSQRLLAMMPGNQLFCRYVLLLSCVLVDGAVHVSVDHFQKPLSLRPFHACSKGSVDEHCTQRYTWPGDVLVCAAPCMGDCHVFEEQAFGFFGALRTNIQVQHHHLWSVQAQSVRDSLAQCICSRKQEKLEPTCLKSTPKICLGPATNAAQFWLYMLMPAQQRVPLDVQWMTSC